MTQMTTVRKIKTHQTLMRLHESLVDLQIGRAARETLHIDPPFIGIEIESFEGTSLAGQFHGVNVLVATVVTSARVTLGILVGHGRTERIVDGA